MTVNITDATTYIEANVIDIEDWTDADDAKKTRILNVANQTLSRRFPDVTIPDNAVYDFSAVLAIVFNDTNRFAQQDIKSLSVAGVATFSFSSPGAKELYRFIPKSTVDLINDVNDVKVSNSRAQWTVL